MKKQWNTLGLPCSGITPIERHTSTCQATLTKCLSEGSSMKNDENTKLTAPTCHPTTWSKDAVRSGRNWPPPLSKEETTYVQAVAGTLLYHAQAVVGPTILTALSAIVTKQAKPTQETMKKVKQWLDYCATQEDAMITSNACKMILTVHSNTGYKNKKKLQSRAGEHFSLSNNKKSPPTTAPFSRLQQ